MKIVFIHLLNDYSGSTKILSDIVDIYKNKKLPFDLMFGRNGDGFLNHKSENRNLFFYRRSNIKLLTLFYYLTSQTILFFKMFRYSNIDCVIYINTMLPFGPALACKLMLKYPNLYYSTSAFSPKHYPEDIVNFANTRGKDKIMYAGYFPMGLSLDKIFAEMQNVPFKDDVWPMFLGENAKKLLKL